jgi:hypothetical protein
MQEQDMVIARPPTNGSQTNSEYQARPGSKFIASVPIYSFIFHLFATSQRLLEKMYPAPLLLPHYSSS